MGYLGNNNVTQNFTPAVDYFNGNGSTTSFTLSRTVGSAFDVQAFIENVPQNPSSAFTVAGNVITFTSAPPSGTNNIYVRYTSPVTQQVKPAPGTVSPTEINSAYSLWNLSGSTINYTAGNVGIGTTTPASKLDVFADTATFGDTGSFNFAINGTNILFKNGAGGTTERMRITSAGNVGIGNNGADARLVVQGTLGNNGDASRNVILLSSDSATALVGAGIAFGGYYNGTSAQINDFGTIQGFKENSTANDYAGALRFTTRTNGNPPTERVRIASGGGLRIACENFANQPSSSNWGIELNNTSASSVFFGQGTGTETHINFGNRNGIRGSIQTTSGGTSYNTTSDYRLKENIAPMTGALNKVAQLNPVTYNWKIGGNGQGFIAHELQEVVPEAVTGEKDAVDENGEPKYQMVDTSFLVATLTAAIQEQQAIIEDLKARIEILEAK